MPDGVVEDAHHLMRFVPYNQQIRNSETDAFEGIVGTAFRVRESDDGGLSVTWVEHYGENCLATLRVAACAFRDSLPSKRIGPKACFAIGEAGHAKQVSSARNKKIRLVHAPDGPNTGHVEIHRFSDDDLALLDALAMDVFTEHRIVGELHLD